MILLKVAASHHLYDHSFQVLFELDNLHSYKTWSMVTLRAQYLSSLIFVLGSHVDDATNNQFCFAGIQKNGNNRFFYKNCNSQFTTNVDCVDYPNCTYGGK